MNILLPSLKVAGGTIEAIKLINKMESVKGNIVNSKIYVLWKSSSEVSLLTNHLVRISNWETKILYAFFQLPFLLFYFYRAKKKSNGIWIFTHYSTFLFSLLIKKNKRYFFIQGVEWEFSKNMIIRYILKKFIIKLIGSGKIITTNKYLEEIISEHGLITHRNLGLWADKRFFLLKRGERSIDGVMVLRKGAIKRLDLYRKFIIKAKVNGAISLAVITPEVCIFNEFKNIIDYCYLNPSIHEMRAIYSNSKIFIHLSDSEGFGLPPLESMGSGCIPLCRDSGGVRVYMEALSEYGLLLPKTLNIDFIYDKFKILLDGSEELDFLSRKSISIFKSGFKKSSNMKSPTEAN
jgi:hypothetical protein